MNSVEAKMLSSIEHKFGKESNEAITFKLMIISHDAHPFGKITSSKLTEYWKQCCRKRVDK